MEGPELPPPSETRRQSTISSVRGKRLTTLARVFTSLSLRKYDDVDTPEDTTGPLGLHTLFDSPEPLADLVFVHGLGGGSRKTWDKGRDPELYWPREWLSRDPDFKHVRVHTFGYHADWSERQESILSIDDFANSLLAQLQASSMIRRSKTVPLIFVCHSMGGLVVKRAFILAQHDGDFQALGRRFDTIYFLATPHHGAGSAQLLNALIRLTQSGNKPFLADLKQDSPAIQAINNEFRHYSNNIRSYSFFETKPTHIHGVGDILIVQKASAVMYIPNERISPIEANHPGVCKYTSPSDPNYVLVRESIVETLDRIKEAWTLANEESLKAKRRHLRTFLRVSDTHNRFSVEFDEPRVEGSCEWLTLEPSFRRWRDALQPQIFWLNGHPGTGKTFLAKYVATHVGDLGYSYSCFFFSAGSKTHSSITGCLLSLALQMAEDNAFIRDLLLEMDDTECSFNPESFQSIWRTLFVGGVFQTKALKPHFWVIDGLDECTDYIELFPLLANIKSTYPLQIFISSRHIPEAQNSFASHGLKAEMYHLNRENTAGDIKRYVENHIDFPSFESNTEKQKMISTIHRKSEGSFMWVRLILRELRGALSEEATKKVLREVPRGMDKVYSRSLEPLAKEASRRPVAKAILMWASTCTRAISTSVLKHALIIHVNETFNRLENHISWLCGYLVTVDAHSHVKMVHETARRFILDPNNGSPVAFSEQEAHESLAVVCLKYLNDKELKAPKGRRSSAAQGTPLTRSPFFPYAALAFHEHIQRSKSTSEEIFRLVCSFLEHTGGNVLTWIEHVASTDKGMATLVRAGTILRAFALRIGKDRMRRTEKLDLVLSWSSDLMRVAAKFGRNLERFPQSIFTIVPQFCPRASPMYRQYGHSNRSMGVYGVQSLLEWDDCIATIAYKQKGQRTMSVGATSNLFAVGMSGPFLRLYHTNTCQEYTMLHHGTAVGVIEFNVNGSLLATAGGLKVCLWDVPSKSLLWIFELSRTCIAITFDSEAEELVLACQDNQLYYVQLDSGNLQDKVPWFLDEEQAQKIVRDPSTAAFSPQHQLLAIVYRGGHIGLWNWETDEFEGHCIKPGAGTQRCPFHASSLVFSPVPNSNSLAASYEQGEIIVFDPFDQSIKASYKANTDNQTLACSPDGRTLLAGDSSGFIRIFDFQSFDAPDGKLRLLHMISGVEEPIRTLAFLDDKRFVDLRGRKIKVWEPTALVRSEASNSDTESIASEETMHPSPASGEGPDMITAMSIHPNGKHIFCATQSGVINIFEASTGKLLQTIFDHSRGDTILWMILGKSGDILATAGISSKVFIHRIAHQREWTLEEKLLEYRMGEPIEQLLFNPGCTKILVVTTTRDMVYCLEEGRQSSAHWETRLPGMWCNNPEDPEQLLLWVNQKLRVFVWNDLMEITAPDGIELDFDLPDKFGIRNVFTGGRGSYVATVYSEVDHSRASIRLLFWDAKAAGQGRGSSTISPMYQVYGSRISDLVSTLGMIIGFSGNRVLFLEQDGWICSMIVDEHEPESYSRHFFLPADWTSTNDALLMAWMPNNNIIFVKGDELAVIKRGLDLSQDIPLSARSRRSSNSA